MAWDDLISDQLGLNWSKDQKLRNNINDTSLSSDIFKCPSDPHDNRFQKSYAANILRIINDQVNGNTPGIIGLGQGDYNNMSAMMPRIGIPSQTLVTAEFWHQNNLAGAKPVKAIYQGWFYNRLQLDPSNLNAQALLGHDGLTLQSCLMADGSAKLMRGWELVKDAPALGANHTGTYLDHRDK